MAGKERQVPLEQGIVDRVAPGGQVAAQRRPALQVEIEGAAVGGGGGLAVTVDVAAAEAAAQSGGKGRLERTAQFVGPAQILLPVGVVPRHHAAQDLHPGGLDADSQQAIIEHDAAHALGDVGLFQVFDGVAG